MGGAAVPEAPIISIANREFLSRLARRTALDHILGRPIYEPAYVPSALKSLKADRN